MFTKFYKAMEPRGEYFMKKTFIISEILLASLFCFAVALSPALAGTITNGFNNPACGRPVHGVGQLLLPQPAINSP